MCVGHLEHVPKTADVFETPFIPLNACELQNSPFCFCYETSSCVLQRGAADHRSANVRHVERSSGLVSARPLLCLYRSLLNISKSSGMQGLVPFKLAPKVLFNQKKGFVIGARALLFCSLEAKELS